jgi:hypothetical protein
VDSNGLLYLAMPGAPKVCIPNIKVGKENSLNLCELLILHAYEIVVHRGFWTYEQAAARSILLEDHVGCFQMCQILSLMSDERSIANEAICKNHPLPVRSGPGQFI